MLSYFRDTRETCSISFRRSSKFKHLSTHLSSDFVTDSKKLTWDTVVVAVCWSRGLITIHAKLSYRMKFIFYPVLDCFRPSLIAGDHKRAHNSCVHQTHKWHFFQIQQSRKFSLQTCCAVSSLVYRGPFGAASRTCQLNGSRAARKDKAALNNCFYCIAAQSGTVNPALCSPEKSGLHTHTGKIHFFKHTPHLSEWTHQQRQNLISHLLAAIFLSITSTMQTRKTQTNTL